MRWNVTLDRAALMSGEVDRARDEATDDDRPETGLPRNGWRFD